MFKDVPEKLALPWLFVLRDSVIFVGLWNMVLASALSSVSVAGDQTIAISSSAVAVVEEEEKVEHGVEVSKYLISQNMITSEILPVLYWFDCKWNIG